MKYNIIQHITTSCNFDCSYCDVIKDGRVVTKNNIENVQNFIKNNYLFINRFKFFGGEPLLRWKDIKNIIDGTNKFIGNKYEIVTNTTLLNNEIGDYFDKYFEIIFFSIDSENKFDYEGVFNFIFKHNLENKVYFNLIISPGRELEAEKQFKTIYERGLKNFNILPVYFTKVWDKINLFNLSKVLKNIIDTSIEDKTINLYGFQSNNGYNSSLINESLFIDVDCDIFYSDFVSTFLGKEIKDKLFLGKIDSKFSLSNIDFKICDTTLKDYEKKLIKKIPGQYKLHLIMDYFSLYLNNKSNGL